MPNTTKRAGVRVFEARKFSVEEVEVRTHAGPTVTRAVVRHPGSVVVLPVLASGDVVMIRNHRFAVGHTLWELPAGTLEPGEEAHDCAMRELEEETGHRTRELSPLASFYTSPGFCDERIHAFLAVDAYPAGPTRHRPTELIETEIVPRSRVERMIARAELLDAKTLLTLLLWLRGSPPPR